MKWPWSEKIIERVYVPENSNEPKSIDEQLKKEALSRIRETLKNWATAVAEAEYIDKPDRTALFDLYQNIELDEHITALYDSILFSVTQTPFHIIDSTGEPNEEKTKLFKKNWFNEFIKYVLESDYWGYSLIQFKPIENGIFSGVENVDRYHIKPEKNGVCKYRYSDDIDFYYDKQPYDKWTIFVKGDKKLGRYNHIAKTFILKREVTQFWAVFNELFTTPHYYVKTDFNNKKHRNDLINFFEKRRHSGFSVFGLEDEINILSNNGQGWLSYKEFENTRNQQISKAFLGQTMVFDDGSSRSQAEVHERQKDIFIQGKRVWISGIINEKLIPKMAQLGIKISVDDEFAWDLTQEMTSKDYADTIQKVGSYFDFDDTEITEKIGLTVSKKEQLSSQSDKFSNFKKIADQIKQIYNQK